MNKEEKFVITISRQFGTGGHEIGVELARRLGVKLLDKQILNEVASASMLSRKPWNISKRAIRCGVTISPTSTVTT